MGGASVEHCRQRLERGKIIEWCWLDAGDNQAGWIRLPGKPTGGARRYRVGINQNHSPPVQLTTLAHELGHLFLGHLGADERLGVSSNGCSPEGA